MAGTCQIWAEPFVTLRIPKIFNLRTDPFERADITSNTYWDWMIDHHVLVDTRSENRGRFPITFREFPPRQKAASFTVDQVMEKLLTSIGTEQPIDRKLSGPYVGPKDGPDFFNCPPETLCFNLIHSKNQSTLVSRITSNVYN